MPLLEKLTWRHHKCKYMYLLNKESNMVDYRITVGKYVQDTDHMNTAYPVLHFARIAHPFHPDFKIPRPRIWDLTKEPVRLDVVAEW